MALKPEEEKNRGQHPAENSRPGILGRVAGEVRRLRSGQALSRKSLAQRTGLSERFLAQVESGTGNISLSNLDLLAAALGVEPSSLISPEPSAGMVSDSAQAQLRRVITEALPQADEATLLVLQETLEAAGFIQRDEWPVIALVGLRGAGKSTIGPLLAERLELPFLELDDQIEDLTGLALGEIYELHGEQYYRAMEAQALKNLVVRNQPVVVAVSGGIVNHPPSFELLNSGTRWVWLRADPELHMERVLAQGDQRPVQNRPNAMMELRHLIQSRSPLYRQARWSLDTSTRTAAGCAEELAAAILKGRF